MFARPSVPAAWAKCGTRDVVVLLSRSLVATEDLDAEMLHDHRRISRKLTVPPSRLPRVPKYDILDLSLTVLENVVKFDALCAVLGAVDSIPLALSRRAGVIVSRSLVLRMLTGVLALRKA